MCGVMPCTDTKNKGENMRNYRRIPFNRIKDIETYAERKLKAGHAIVQILVNETTETVDNLISYGNDVEAKSGYLAYVGNAKQLKDMVIVEKMTPKVNIDYVEGIIEIEIDNESQGVITCPSFKTEFRNMEEHFREYPFTDESNKRTYHYEFYISNEKANISNFGGDLELHFLYEWVGEYGWECGIEKEESIKTENGGKNNMSKGTVK